MLGHSINEWLSLFEINYRYLYEHPEFERQQEYFTGYGDALLAARAPEVAEFVKARGDLLTSDREVTAFGMVYYSFARGLND